MRIGNREKGKKTKKRKEKRKRERKRKEEKEKENEKDTDQGHKLVGRLTCRAWTRTRAAANNVLVPGGGFVGYESSERSIYIRAVGQGVGVKPPPGTNTNVMPHCLKTDN